jgi:PAS domain S-box-containing protein
MLTVIITSLAVFVVAIPERPWVDMFGYMVVPILFASMFLRTPVWLALAALDLAGLVMVEWLVPGFEAGSILAGPVMTVGAAIVLFWVFSRHRDALERDRRAELAEKEERYRTLVEQIPAITYLDAVDASGAVRLYVSPQFEQWLGYSPDEHLVSFERWLGLIHPDDRERVRAEAARHAAGSERAVQEYRLVGRDGRVVWVRDEFVQRRDEAGGRLVNQGVLLDVTEHKRGEEALRRREKQFRDLLESAPDAMVIVGPDGLIRLVNSQTEKLFDWPRAELLGQPIEILIPDRFRDLHPGHRQVFLQEPQPRVMGGSLKIFGLRRDGESFPVEVNLGLLETEEGVLITAALRDVSERVKAAERLREQRSFCTTSSTPTPT